jgi:hypothetical protein
MSQYAYVSLSLIGLCALAGAGVGVGSGVAMMYSQMVQAEQEQKTSGAVAHSPGMCSCIILTLRIFAYSPLRLRFDRSLKLIFAILLQLRGKIWPLPADLLLLVPEASKLKWVLPGFSVFSGKSSQLLCGFECSECGVHFVARAILV